MINRRANSGVFAIENEVIYAFGGFYTNPQFIGMNSIEVLNLKDKINSWKVL